MQALERHGKCSHKEISQFVANKLDANSSDKSFKKNIYNDLDGLIGDNVVSVEYRTRDDELIPLGEEDNYKNKRNCFYYLIGSDTDFLGGGLLKKAGIKFQKQKSSLPQWKVSDVRTKDQPTEDVVCLLFKSQNKYLCLEAPLLDLPANIVVGGVGNTTPDVEIIDKNFGGKTSLLLFPSEFLSPSGDNSFGDFLLNIDNNSQRKLSIGFQFLQNDGSLNDRMKLRLNEINQQIHLHDFWVNSFLETNNQYKEMLGKNKNPKNILDEISSSFKGEDEESLASKILFLENIFCLGKEEYLIHLLNERNNLSETSNIKFEDKIKIAKSIGYSRINDFIHDAKAKGTLYVPSIIEKIERKNKGDKNTFHGKKPPQAKKVQSISRLHATEKFQLWENAKESTFSLPIGIKINPGLEIYITDIYANSSYKKKAA